MQHISRVVLACLVATLVAVGCGGGGDENGGTADETGAATPSPSPTSLLVEDFESEETAFETGTNGNAEISVEDGQLKLYSEDDEAESVAPLSEPAPSLTFDVDVEIGDAEEALDAGTEDWFGVGCTAGEDAYFMLADVYGSFYVFSRKNGEYNQIGDNYKQNFEVREGDVYHLSAACTTDPTGTAVGLSLFIDGKEVLSGSDAKNPITPFDGVAVFGQQDKNEGNIAYSTFLFDNVEVQPQEA